MLVPSHMHITASLMAGYTFDDGSLLEVDAGGDYRITNAGGDVIAETVDTQTGQFAGLNTAGLNTAGGPPQADDYGDIVDDLAAFLDHDSSRYEYIRDEIARSSGDLADIDDGDDYIFCEDVAMWAYEHHGELGELTSYREDKRLYEEVQ